ncbi:MAG: aminotransferase class III-fold pyridoxal phosphate-dependent enzyme, partial [Anaerolineae bacterium]
MPGTHGGTYGGNPVACAAAEATVRVIQDGLVENAKRMGAVLLSGLSDVQARYPILGDVRGLGLMVAAEFTLPDGAPAADLVKEVLARCRTQGLLLLNCGTYGNVVRWIPPLVVDRDQVEAALQVFERALADSI